MMARTRIQHPVNIGIAQLALMGATAFVCWVLYSHDHPVWACVAAVLGAFVTMGF